MVGQGAASVPGYDEGVEGFPSAITVKGLRGPTRNIVVPASRPASRVFMVEGGFASDRSGGGDCEVRNPRSQGISAPSSRRSTVTPPTITGTAQAGADAAERELPARGTAPECGRSATSGKRCERRRRELRRCSRPRRPRPYRRDSGGRGARR